MVIVLQSETQCLLSPLMTSVIFPLQGMPSESISISHSSLLQCQSQGKRIPPILQSHDRVDPQHLTSFITVTAFSFQCYIFQKIQLSLEDISTLPVNPEGEITASLVPLLSSVGTSPPQVSCQIYLSATKTRAQICILLVKTDCCVCQQWKPKHRGILLSPLTLECFDFLSRLKERKALNLKQTRQASQRAEEAQGSALNGLAVSPCSLASSQSGHILQS